MHLPRGGPSLSAVPRRDPLISPRESCAIIVIGVELAGGGMSPAGCCRNANQKTCSQFASKPSINAGKQVGIGNNGAVLAACGATALPPWHLAPGGVAPAGGPSTQGILAQGRCIPAATHVFTCSLAGSLVGVGSVPPYRRSAPHPSFCSAGFPGTALRSPGGCLRLTALPLLRSLGGRGGQTGAQAAAAKVPESMNH